jgi:decaprenyl-phosphate phosphoribosyltransferase
MKEIVRQYIKLMRVKHYIKNLVVFIPMFFGGHLFDKVRIMYALGGFVCFCLISSSVYILNDLCDIEKDRNHPTKKNRPLASGKIKPKSAITLMIVFVVAAIIISILLKSIMGAAMLALYFALNVAYSFGLKDKPILDIVILASGYVIRIFYGGFITGVIISKWLYLVVVSGSLYMGLGKQRNELKSGTNTRKVLAHYNTDFLDKNMYVCVALTNVFYAIWTLDLPNQKISWTIPFFMIILMCYSLNVEKESDGDPVEVILKDKLLVALVIVYAICIFALLYFPA